MSTDKILKIGQSSLQYGPSNNRVYIMKLAAEDVDAVLQRSDALAREHGFGKIFAKIPGPLAAPFLEAGYGVEARVPRFYDGRDEALFLGRYLDPQRAKETRAVEVERNLAIAHAKARDGIKPAPDYRFEEASEADLEAVAAIYARVFATYPFPIHDPDYLLSTMHSHVRYFVARKGDTIAAVSSAEMDKAHGNVEMTDFATHPDHTGHGLAAVLLEVMNAAMKQAKMSCAYTIARAYSASMNITFARLGYAFAGTLTRNTDISGDIESMNVWYLPLEQSARCTRQEF